MAEINVSLVAVDRSIWSGSARMVVARTVEGDIGVMAGHAPLLAQLREGFAARIVEDDGHVFGVAVHGGFLSVTKDGVTDPGRGRPALRRDRRQPRPAGLRAGQGRGHRLGRGRGRAAPRPGPVARHRSGPVAGRAGRRGGIMQLAEFIGFALLLAVIVLVVLLAVRRSSLARNGAMDVGWRDQLDPDGRGWVLGQARYTRIELDLYRSFSPLPWPPSNFAANPLTLGERRAPVGTELDLLPVGSVIVRCTGGSGQLELAMSEDALTGLRSWLESAPPGSGVGHISRGQG